MVTIRIPSALRTACNGERAVDVSAGTVGESLGTLCQKYDALRPHLFHANGVRTRHVLVAVNGEARDDSHLLKPGDEIDLVVATAGGAPLDA